MLGNILGSELSEGLRKLIMIAGILLTLAIIFAYFTRGARRAASIKKKIEETESKRELKNLEEEEKKRNEESKNSSPKPDAPDATNSNTDQRGLQRLNYMARKN